MPEKDKSRGTYLVANRATLPQKCPPPPWNVADLCELAATTSVQDAAVKELLFPEPQPPAAHTLTTTHTHSLSRNT